MVIVREDFLERVKGAQRIDFGEGESLFILQEVAQPLTDSLSPLIAPGESIYYGLATEKTTLRSAPNREGLVGEAEWWLVLSRAVLHLTMDATGRSGILRTDCRRYPLKKLSLVKLAAEIPQRSTISLEFETGAIELPAVASAVARAFASALVQRQCQA